MNSDAIDVATSLIRRELPVTVNGGRLHSNKLRIGHLAGNHFTITITELTVPEQEAFGRAERVASLLRERGLPNYFGPQRFGYDGENVRRGREIVSGRLKMTDRWLRRYLVNSYQSHLCNLYLALRLGRGLFDRVLVGDIARKYATRSFFEVKDAETEQARYVSHEISFTAPMYGCEMRMATGIPGELESRVLAKAGLTLNSFEGVKANGSRRIGRLLPQDLRVKTSPEGLTLNFTLPRGGFATTLVREFMKTDPMTSEGHDTELA